MNEISLASKSKRTFWNARSPCLVRWTSIAPLPLRYTRSVEENFRCQKVTFSTTYSIDVLPGTAVIINASGDLQTYNGRGTEIFQPLISRPSSAVWRLESELNCACTISKVNAAAGVYKLGYDENCGHARSADGLLIPSKILCMATCRQFA